MMENIEPQIAGPIAGALVVVWFILGSKARRARRRGRHIREVQK